MFMCMFMCMFVRLYHLRLRSELVQSLLFCGAVFQAVRRFPIEMAVEAGRIAAALAVATGPCSAK